MLQVIVWFLSVLLVSTKSVKEYQCFIFPFANKCVLARVTYQPGQKIVFPVGYQHFRVDAVKHSSSISSNITTLDDHLYEAMHRPAIIEMDHVQMRRLMLPADLQTGSFAYNEISSLEVNYTQSYHINYLDLGSNQLSNITNISALINLETLNLSRNGIEIIDELTFAPLVKLKRLYLKYNEFKTFPWKSLPSTLAHLDCSSGELESTDFKLLNLPALKYLNLEENKIISINVSGILRGAPNLLEAYLFNRAISSHDMARIVEAFNHSTVYESDQIWCYSDEEVVDGRCTKRRQVAISVWKAFLLAVVILVVGTLFVFVVYRTVKQNNL
ncbi:uncharacterized protein LOC131683882 [Topomyia yanbarensis]|uniref:uncharacterized protein LOC131683882 n=1 Tax=Topomyia yanbarensis TaxID=2498891 RepID=UPI00273C1462|nr:uncharacterized protein LOC131683882 [Topomyia yanbarensis]